MNLDSPAVLFSGMLIGTIGFGLFMYGRKTPNVPCLVAGIVFSLVPFVAHSLLALWGISGACGAALYVLRRAG
jgi:uncharacterized membrane protein (UPF0136 family)